jgi:hypothetical protein
LRPRALRLRKWHLQNTEDKHQTKTQKYCGERPFLLGEKLEQADKSLAPSRTVDAHGNKLPILPIICDQEGHCDFDSGTCRIPKTNTKHQTKTQKYYGGRAFLLVKNRIS